MAEILIDTNTFIHHVNNSLYQHEKILFEVPLMIDQTTIFLKNLERKARGKNPIMLPPYYYAQIKMFQKFSISHQKLTLNFLGGSFPGDCFLLNPKRDHLSINFSSCFFISSDILWFVFVIFSNPLMFLSWYIAVKLFIFFFDNLLIYLDSTSLSYTLFCE